LITTEPRRQPKFARWTQRVWSGSSD